MFLFENEDELAYMTERRISLDLPVIQSKRVYLQHIYLIRTEWYV